MCVYFAVFKSAITKNNHYYGRHEEKLNLFHIFYFKKWRLARRKLWNNLHSLLFRKGLPSQSVFMGLCTLYHISIFKSMPSSLQLRPADIFGEVRIHSAGLTIAPFVLKLLFCGCDLATPGGAVRLSYGIEDAGNGWEGYVSKVFFGLIFTY